ncbi:MAG TPA: NAD(P)H-hydrate epimerase [Sedimentisphaerales bacterium]|nr:NAD(P)H-hydrate epimerase [Sedimentisphaerales bacterium]
MSLAEVRAVDAWAINEVGIPGVVLMENAGRSCAELIKEKLAGVANPKVCIFCGTGNNGGDGFVIARHLLNSGFGVVVVICGDRSRIKGDARTNLDILEKLGQPVAELDVSGGDIEGRVKALADGADVIVDALYGTGLSGQLRPEHRELVESINGRSCPVLAVDIPSGLDCDTGEALGAAVRATWTVSFVAAKKGFACERAQQYTGEVFVASIGVGPSRAILD